MTLKLVIFDMDGTLVQSEDCASQALLDVIPGLTGTPQEISDRYRGVKLTEIFMDIETLLPGSIPENCVELYRERENLLSTTLIKPTAGVRELLSKLNYARCIASNAPVVKTERSLKQCGLRHFFNDQIFSAYQVQAWKPDPRLFLYAAEQCGVKPHQCLVVEDSEVGIEAARAAGMESVLYDPNRLIPDPRASHRIDALTDILNIIPQS